jgi:hypothetical protein
MVAGVSHVGRVLLLSVSVFSLNAVLSTASAETCVTGVSSAFANVVNGVSGQPGPTVVTSVTPTMAPALTGVTTSAVPFLPVRLSIRLPEPQ